MSIIKEVEDQLLELLRNDYVEAALEQQFQTLADKWRAETGHLSSTTKIVLHPTYQRIIGLGPIAIGAILRDLRQTYDHWFWALSAITGENPIKPEDAGDIEKMVEVWVKWGQGKGYI